MRWILLPVAFLSILALRGGTVASPPVAPASSLVEPPFARQWTQFVGDNTAVVAVRGNRVYYRSAFGVGALDLATGKSIWRSLTDHHVEAAQIQGNTLYALYQKDKATLLAAVDISETGQPVQQPRLLARLPAPANDLATDPKRLYVLDETAMLRAYHPTTGAVLWSRPLGSAKPPSLVSGRLVATVSGLLVGIDDVGEFGVEAESGKVRWKRRGEYAHLYPPLVITNGNGAGDVITEHDGLRRTNLRTGKPVWKVPGDHGEAVLVGDVVVDSNQKLLTGRKVSNGQILWQLPLRDTNMAYSMGSSPILSDGQSVWIEREPFLCITKGGKEKWVRAKPFTGTAYYADAERIITVDGRILCYRKGQLPSLPTSDAGKQALAQQLATRFEILDEAERKQLKKLAPFAFPLLLNRYIAWAKVYDTKSERAEDNETHYHLSSLLTDVQPLLRSTFRKGDPEDTRAAVAALSSLSDKSRWRGELEQMLQAKGEVNSYIPFLVQRLRQLPFNQREGSEALDAVSHSSHPEAVSLMLEALRDPKAAPAWRQEAFRHLAGTGGAKGIEAVRAVRESQKKRLLVKPWYARASEDFLDNDRKDGITRVAKDNKGRTWMLFQSAVLGNRSDLFIAPKLPGGTWGRPLFTGVWTSRTFNNPNPQRFRGIPIARLASKEWIHLFPDDVALRRDTDGDGLTDGVEARLGTNPNRADTDGDGQNDAVDPCPNAVPHPLTTDTEKIIVACVEARFFEENWGVPALLYIENTKKFELYGYMPTVLWQGTGKTARKNTLDALFGGGVNVLDFLYPDRNRNEKTLPKTFLQFGPDGKTARTVIRRYSGGMNGDGTEMFLKKIGEEWFVVDMKLQFVS